MVERVSGAIIDLDVALPRHFVSHDNLAAARDVDPDKYRFGLGCWELSVCGPGEDVVSLAASAAWRLLQRHPELKEKIGICIVGTESGVDCAKPTASFVHQLTELPSTCRTFEVKHACYGATAALQMAQSWVCMHPTRYALVVAADIARYERHSPGEPTQGAGAVAMLVGCVPEEEACLTLSPVSGTHSSEVYDFWRPNYQSAALVKGKYSVRCYLESLTAAYDDYHSQAADSCEPAYMLYHIPFPHMARKAHFRLMEHVGMREEVEIAADYERRVAPSLWANRRVGNVYSASLYLALAGLWEREADKLEGKTIALFSYGSGSCGEYYTARFGGRKPQIGLRSQLDLRTEVDVKAYEALSDEALSLEQNDTYRADMLSGHVPFTFLGIREHERVYRQEIQSFAERVGSNAAEARYAFFQRS